MTTDPLTELLESVGERSSADHKALSILWSAIDDVLGRPEFDPIPRLHEAVVRARSAMAENPPADYELWVSAERTMLVRIWRGGGAEVAVRHDTAATWGPPVRLTRETA